MEDFVLPEFMLDDIDFDFSSYEETLLSSDLEITQKPQSTSHDHHYAHHDDDRKHLGLFCERPAKKMKCDSWNPAGSRVTTKPSSSSKLISFEFSSVPSLAIGNNTEIEPYGGSPIIEQGTGREACASRKRSSVLAKEHVLAERKRREKLTERFIALSALLPGLKKADKATVLGDAITHLKQLQERVGELEREKEVLRGMKSTILVKKSRVYFGEETSSPSPCSSSSSLYSDDSFNDALPEIEVKVSKDDVLLRIHCQKSKGCVIDILNEIEKLHLNVMNSTVLPFGNSTLDITVLAKKKDEDFCMTVTDMVKSLRLAVL